MLEGCVKLGATLLDHYEPSGSRRRDSNPSDKDIEDDLEEFFEDATCTGYDRDIQDYFKDKDRKRNRKTRTVVRAMNDLIRKCCKSIHYVLQKILVFFCGFRSISPHFVVFIHGEEI